jgi:hypothetical protein
LSYQVGGASNGLLPDWRWMEVEDRQRGTLNRS